MRILAVLLVISATAFSQSRIQTTSQQPDVSLLVSSQDALANFHDYKATGTIHYFESNDEADGAVTFRGLKNGALRCDISMGGQNRSWMVEGLSGQSKRGDAKPVALSMEIAANLRHYVLPALPLTNEHGHPQPKPSRASDPPGSKRSSFSPGMPIALAARGPKIELVVDDSSSTISSVSSPARGRNSKAAPVEQQLFFSDYRAVNGVMFPFTIEERLGGQKVSVIHLQDVTLNSGLTLADIHF